MRSLVLIKIITKISGNIPQPLRSFHQVSNKKTMMPPNDFGKYTKYISNTYASSEFLGTCGAVIGFGFGAINWCDMQKSCSVNESRTPQHIMLTLLIPTALGAVGGFVWQLGVPIAVCVAGINLDDKIQQNKLQRESEKKEYEKMCNDFRH